VQLRQEDKEGVLYNLVGFQTKLRVGEQQRLIRGLPGLSKAVFARYGSVHRNTYINAPRRLSPTLELFARPGLYIAGQMAGVEGYVESAALGFLAGVNTAFVARGEMPPLPPPETAHAGLLRHLANDGGGKFQPSNINYGLLPPLSSEFRRIPRRDKRQHLAERALAALDSWRERIRPTEVEAKPVLEARSS
jgi:methylenetetrahydrofolate--tRNA-(uracil-5-)-methyltransferase